jgi:tripartite-type tricarboxylate transporter receptor subunit TctC
VRDALTKLGANPLGGTPEEFAAHVQEELRRWHEVVVRSGAKVE